MTKRIVCFPLTLWPRERLLFSNCTIVPGLKLQQPDDLLIQALEEARARSSFHDSIHPTHCVVIDEERYESGVRKRIQSGGGDQPRHYILDSQALVRQVLVALTLIAGTSFKVGNAYKLEIGAERRRPVYTVWNMGPSRIEGVQRLVEGMLASVGKPTSGRQLQSLGARLDLYYRSGVWWTDRLSLCLGMYWGALCTPFPEQSFASLMSALEGLFSTGASEVTHSLAERVAIVVGHSSRARSEIYREVKMLYGTRSKVVHGSAHPKRGLQTYHSLVVTAKRSNIPVDQLQRLIWIVRESILSVLRTPALRDIFQRSANSETEANALNDYFYARLFG